MGTEEKGDEGRGEIASTEGEAGRQKTRMVGTITNGDENSNSRRSDRDTSISSSGSNNHDRENHGDYQNVVRHQRQRQSAHFISRAEGAEVFRSLGSLVSEQPEYQPPHCLSSHLVTAQHNTQWIVDDELFTTQHNREAVNRRQ